MGSYAHDNVDETAAAPGTRAERRERATADTRGGILDAARAAILADGYAALSTRRVAELAGVPLSQIHYHFGSKRQLVLAVLAAENARLLERQAEMYDAPDPLWVRWDRACDFLDADLRSGYVRILHEMVAAGHRHGWPVARSRQPTGAASTSGCRSPTPTRCWVTSG